MLPALLKSCHSAGLFSEISPEWAGRPAKGEEKKRDNLGILPMPTHVPLFSLRKKAKRLSVHELVFTRLE